MGGRCLVSSRSAVAVSPFSGSELVLSSAVAHRCLCWWALSLSSGVALLGGEHNYYIFIYLHYLRNYLKAISFKVRGLGFLGDAVRILRGQAFLVAYSLLPNLVARFQPNSVACFLPNLLARFLPKFYERTLHPNHQCPRPSSLTKVLSMSLRSKNWSGHRS